MYLVSAEIFIVIVNLATASVVDRKYLTVLACRRSPHLELCEDTRPQQHEPTLRLITPPPIPDHVPQKDVATKQSPDDLSDIDRALEKQLSSSGKVLRLKCARVAPIVSANCQPKKIAKSNVARCAAYFRDCAPFLPKADPLYAIANSFSSGVNINLATVDVNGIPYYPINEEGSVGVTHQLSVPFGSWGGGYSDHVGVRDYWSQHQEVGANWYEGKYGYKNGWSVPLVQSLGIEGGQHNTVSVPLHGKDAGTVMVDNGYGVGGYYGHNDHVGVDWRKGSVQHNFGVGVPFAHTGVNTGQAVAFPGPDVWQRALGRK